MPKTIFRNESCFVTMEYMIAKDMYVDCILTSPPYNTNKSVSPNNPKSVRNRDVRYDVFIDDKTDEEYIEWTTELFELFDKVLNKNGVILYNLSYGSGSKSNKSKVNELMWLVVAEIIKNTNFTVADRIIWKKCTALPNNRSANKLTRIVEDIFVFVRKSEYMTFNCNKQIVSISNGTQRHGQKSYENVYNFVMAKNNDECCPLNKATYSTELCEKLLNLYCREGAKVYDPFSGTGTTAVACKRLGMSSINSEISKAQVEWAKRRLQGW